VTSATHSSAGSEPSQPGSAVAAAKHFEIERTKYAAPVQPFEPYDAWRLGPPVPGCQDARIEAAQAIAEYRTPSDPAVGAPRHTPGAVARPWSGSPWRSCAVSVARSGVRAPACPDSARQSRARCC